MWALVPETPLHCQAELAQRTREKQTVQKTKASTWTLSFWREMSPVVLAQAQHCGHSDYAAPLAAPSQVGGRGSEDAAIPAKAAAKSVHPETHECPELTGRDRLDHQVFVADAARWETW